MKTLDIWTDGSSHNNGDLKGCGGYGLVMHYGEAPETQEELFSDYGEDRQQLKLSGGYRNTTNQQMEIKAVTEGLKRVTNPNVKIRVFSDSAYVLNCFKQKWYEGWIRNGWKTSTKKPVKNKEWWQELFDVVNSDIYDIEWRKVKGHSGIYYNEVADDLAGAETKKIAKEYALID